MESKCEYSSMQIPNDPKYATAAASSLAGELYAALQGADFVRTHDPAALRDALCVWQALHTASAD